MSKTPFGLLLSTFILYVLMTTVAFAQGTTSRLTGTVTDTSGASVPAATVILSNEGTNVSFTTETSESGAYAFDLIPVGTYRVTVEKPGFKRFVTTGNTVNINQAATVNVALDVGDVSATVTVESTVEQVQTSTSGNVGSTVEQRTLESLPIVGTRGRNPLSLLEFQPGVVTGANTGGGVHVNGSRDRAFNFTLDGIDINESSAGGSNFTPLRTNPDSLQEFQIVTSNATAELGRSSGAQVTLVTRSGTNRLTGNVFEFYQTPRFNANEYGNNTLGIQRGQFVQHIFGGSVGGPIIKNKLFFFTNLQLLRASESRLVSRTVYTQTARNGIFRYVQGGRNFAAGTATPSVDTGGNPLFPNCSATVTTNCIATYNIGANPVTAVDPKLQAVIASAPLPNDFSAGDGLNTAGFNFVAPSNERQYDFVMKFDYKIADNNQIYVRYAQGKQNTFGDFGNGGARVFPDTPNIVDTFRQPKNLAINNRWSPTARLTNEFIFGISRFSFKFATPEPNADFPYTFNLASTPNLNFSYNARQFRTYQFVDNVTFDFSPHVIKTGINFRFGQATDDRSNVGGSAIEPLVDFSQTGASADFTGFNLPASGINTNDASRLRNQINDFLGRVGNYSQAFVALPDGSAFAPAGTRYNFVTKYPEYDFYVQDTWKARQNLTLDLGLRWEFKFAPTSNSLPVLHPDQATRAGDAPTNTIKYVEGDIFKNDYNNLSPSVGFAWDPFKTGKTSVRANYRLSYDRFPTQIFSSSIFQSTPGNNVGVFTTGGLLRNLQPLTPGKTPAALRQPDAFGTGPLTVVDPDLQFPESHQWFIGVQREVWKNNVLEINYIGRRGVHLFGGYNANQVNINASANGQTFLEAFNQVRADPTYNSPLINALYTGSATNNAGTATFRSTNATAISQGAVASAALSASQRNVTTNGVRSQVIANNGFSPFFFQKYPQYTGGLNVLESNDFSRYNGLEFILKRRITSGIGYQFGYTYSLSKDTRSFDPTFSPISTGSVQSASSTPFDINNRDLNYARSDFDRRNVVQGTYVFELPFGRERRFGSDIPRALDYAFGGWQLSGTLVLQSGRPFTVYSGVNTLSNVVSSTVNCFSCSRNFGSILQENGTNYYFSAEQRALFSIPNPGENGNTGRNYFTGPREFRMDMSLSKKFRFTERYSFDLRVDARNVTNTPSFDFPTAVFTSGTFGRIRGSVISFARRIQFSGKFNF